MYKSTHQQHDFIRRVANHSTKGSRRGFVDILPPRAIEIENRYLTLADRFDGLLADRDRLDAEILQLNNTLSKTLQFERYKRLIERRKVLGQQKLDIDKTLGSMRNIVIGKGSESFAFSFMQVCNHMLDNETNDILRHETERILERQQREYSKKRQRQITVPDRLNDDD